jgi:hypothetical protein
LSHTDRRSGLTEEEEYQRWLNLILGSEEGLDLDDVP